jgi:hypothetical protein
MALRTTYGIRAGLTGAAAAVFMASPAASAELARSNAPLTASAPSLSPFSSSYDPLGEVNEWGCWGCWGGGWGGGWHGGGWRRRGPSAGEVLAGAAIVGGIVAIAASANNNNRRNRTRDVVIVERDRFPDDNRNFDERDLDRRNFERREGARPPRVGGAGMARSGANGINAAIDQCLARVQRDVRIDTVDVVERTPQGWLVAGALFNGSGFECRIGNDGRIEGVDYGGLGGGLGAANGTQWDDARYADARRSLGSSAPERAMAQGSAFIPADPNSAVDSDMASSRLATNGEQPLVPLTATRLPAYPGGPVEGEELPPVVERPGIP